MVQQPDVRVWSLALLRSEIEEPQQLRVVERGVRTQRDQEVQPGRLPRQPLVQQPEHAPDRAGSRRVGHQHQHTLAARIELRTEGVHDALDLRVIERLLRAPASEDAHVRPRRCAPRHRLRRFDSSRRARHTARGTTREEVF